MKCKFSQIIADGEHEKLKIMETSTLNKKYIFWLTVQLQKKTCLTGEKFLKPMSIANKINMKAKKREVIVVRVHLLCNALKKDLFLFS